MAVVAGWAHLLQMWRRLVGVAALLPHSCGPEVKADVASTLLLARFAL